MTWYPASTSAVTCFDHSRLLSGQPCNRTTGRPSPSTCTSSVIPLSRVMRISSVSCLSDDGEQLFAAQSRKRLVAPAPAQLHRAFAHARRREDLGGRDQDCGDINVSAQHLGVFASRGDQGPRELI